MIVQNCILLQNCIIVQDFFLKKLVTNKEYKKSIQLNQLFFCKATFKYPKIITNFGQS